VQLRVFIGSSEKDLKYAQAIAKIVDGASEMIDGERSVTAVGWWDRNVFPLGQTLIESLELAVRRANAAILVAGPGDSVQKADGKIVSQPRANVIFEYGMFVAVRGRKQVGLATFFEQVELPSDIGGVLHMRLKTSEPFNEEDFIRDNKAEIESWLKPLKTQASKQASFERCWSVVGDAEKLALEHIVPEIATATQIDMVSIYRPVAGMYRYLDDFRNTPGNRLRVCFANMWDSTLESAYARKIAGKKAGYMRDSLLETIQRYLGDETVVDATDPKRIRATPPAGCAADYRVYLTDQRVTYNYCRVDDVLLIIPLDMKKAQRPSPPGWVFRCDDAPHAFSYYVGDFEKILAESQQIYGTEKAGPPGQ